MFLTRTIILRTKVVPSVFRSGLLSQSLAIKILMLHVNCWKRFWTNQSNMHSLYTLLLEWDHPDLLDQCRTLEAWKKVHSCPSMNLFVYCKNSSWPLYQAKWEKLFYTQIKQARPENATLTVSTYRHTRMASCTMQLKPFWKNHQ